MKTQIGGGFRQIPLNDYVSVIDWLKSRHMNSSKESRKKLAKLYGIDNYNFSEKSNIALLKKLMESENNSELSYLTATSEPSSNDYIEIELPEIVISPESTTESSYGGGFRSVPLREYVSVIDWLKSRHMDSSASARKRLARLYGLQDYDFSAEKNIELLKLLQELENNSALNYQNVYTPLTPRIALPQIVVPELNGSSLISQPNKKSTSKKKLSKHNQGGSITTNFSLKKFQQGGNMPTNNSLNVMAKQQFSKVDPNLSNMTPNFLEGGEVDSNLKQPAKTAFQMANELKKQGIITEVAGEQVFIQTFSKVKEAELIFKQALQKQDVQTIVQLFTKLGIVK